MSICYRCSHRCSVECHTPDNGHTSPHKLYTIRVLSSMHRTKGPRAYTLNLILLIHNPRVKMRRISYSIAESRQFCVWICWVQCRDLQRGGSYRVHTDNLTVFMSSSDYLHRRHRLCTCKLVDCWHRAPVPARATTPPPAPLHPSNSSLPLAQSARGRV